MKKVLEKVKNSKGADKVLKIGQVVCVCSLMLGSVALGEPSVDALASFFAGWIGKIGGLVALVGGVDFALGWKNDDPSERIRGIKTFVAGAMMFAISKAYTSFM